MSSAANYLPGQPEQADADSPAAAPAEGGMEGVAKRVRSSSSSSARAAAADADGARTKPSPTDSIELTSIRSTALLANAPSHTATAETLLSSASGSEGDVAWRVPAGESEPVRDGAYWGDLHGAAPRGFIHPESAGLVWWSYLLTCIALYNVFTVPYRWIFWDRITEVDITWDLQLFIFLDALGDCCFFADIVKNLRLGFEDHEQVCYEPKALRARYMRTWECWIDVATCIPFDLLQLIDLKLHPAYRMNKVLRLFSIIRQINYIELNSKVSLGFKLGKLFFYTGILAHFVACIKYPLLRSASFYDAVFLPKSSFSRWLLSIYWSAGEVLDRGDSSGPEFLADYVLVTACILIGVLWACYFVASLEHYAAQTDEAKEEFNAQIKSVAAFCRELKVPNSLQKQATAYFNYRWASVLHVTDIHDVLEALPPALSSDLRLSLTAHTIGSAELFVGLTEGTLASIAARVTPRILVPQEMVCEENQHASEMYFLQDGEVQLLIQPEDSGGEDLVTAVLRPGDHFGEQGLLLACRTHPYSARALSYCTVYVLSLESLDEVFETFPAARHIVHKNAAAMRVKAAQHTKLIRAKFQLAHVAIILRNRHKQQQQQQQTQLQPQLSQASADWQGHSAISHKHQAKMEAIAADERAPWTISPSAPAYRLWQLLVCIAFYYNYLIIPLRFAFKPHSSAPVILVFDYMSDLVFWVDMLLQCRVRIILRGHEVRDPKRIRESYMQLFNGPFWLHLCASLPLDFFMLATGMQPMWRLNRMLRLPTVHQTISTWIRDSMVATIGAFTYLFSNLVILTHWAGCLYYAFTRVNGFGADPSSSWQLDVSFEGASLALSYFASLSWVVGMLTGMDSGSHWPPTDLAVLYTLGIMAVGLFIVSYMIGALGGLVEEMNGPTIAFDDESTKIESAFNSYHWKPSDAIRQRVRATRKHMWNTRKGRQPGEALKDMPQQLRTDIMFSICGRLIRSVPRFRDLDQASLRALAGELTIAELPADEFVFRQGFEGDQMFFLASGSVSLEVATGHGSEVVKKLRPPSFFGEGVFFSGTRGASAITTSSVRLYVLSAESFTQLIRKHPPIAECLLEAHKDRERGLKQKSASPGPGHARGPSLGAALGGGETSRAKAEAHLSPASARAHHTRAPSSVGGSGGSTALALSPRGGLFSPSGAVTGAVSSYPAATPRVHARLSSVLNLPVSPRVSEGDDAPEERRTDLAETVEQVVRLHHLRMQRRNKQHSNANARFRAAVDIVRAQTTLDAQQLAANTPHSSGNTTAQWPTNSESKHNGHTKSTGASSGGLTARAVAAAPAAAAAAASSSSVASSPLPAGEPEGSAR